tara:strand:- start:1302 stop:1721 length:420 start_codon:yes stop_codon:yes gene_type:complete
MAWKHKYEDMLKEAYKKLPTISKTTSRFEIPTISGGFEGNRTTINNLNQIASKLGRDIKHLKKFLLRELATTGEDKGKKFIFIGKFNSKLINEKIQKYVKEFVVCKQCEKPDTTLKKDKGITFKQCQACGARSSVRSIK